MNAKVYQADYYRKNKDKIAEQKADYYRKNKDKIAEQGAEYRRKKQAEWNNLPQEEKVSRMMRYAKEVLNK